MNRKNPLVTIESCYFMIGVFNLQVYNRVQLVLILKEIVLNWCNESKKKELTGLKRNTYTYKFI